MAEEEATEAIATMSVPGNQQGKPTQPPPRVCQHWHLTLRKLPGICSSARRSAPLAEALTAQ
ncbi:hypothetical protein GCM10027456_65690 [Kineosporia babensis]